MHMHIKDEMPTPELIEASFSDNFPDCSKESKPNWPAGGNQPAHGLDLQKKRESGERKLITHTHDNRKTRRAEDNSGKILNNRKKNKARRNNNVLNKMAYFGMKQTEYRLGISRTEKIPA